VACGREIKDYSGEFQLNLRKEDFSKEALVRMWLTAGSMYPGLEW